MATEVAEAFRRDLAVFEAALASVPAAIADVPWRPGGWTRKQIVGHLLDSAANNRQRFVRATIDGSYAGPTYAQEGWVAAHGYAEQSWEKLLEWWRVEHEILVSIVDRIPEDRMLSPCMVGENTQVTLQFLIEDYVTHQRWHLRQIEEGWGQG
jgi:hypothetical protein